MTSSTRPAPHEAFLAERYGADWREKLQIVEHPHAETSESAFSALFPDYPAAIAAPSKRKAA